MPPVLNINDLAITRGIKTVGVGKKGSKPLTSALAAEIFEDLKFNKVSPAAQGAFFAGLMAKGVTTNEQILEQALVPGAFSNPDLLIECIAPDAPESIRRVCTQLLQGSTLDQHASYNLGKFLFSDEPGDGARGWVASFLRVRYETDEEYAGLLEALHETIDSAFKTKTPPGMPVVQLAEPFDGVDHSYMITPLIGQYIQSLGYRVVHMVGKNSGPKWDMNLWDVTSALQCSPMAGSEDLASAPGDFGWFCHQNLISKSVNQWHMIRQQIIKRPFMATIERFINPFNADIIIASAFHPPYGEKMMRLAEQAGFKGIVIVRNGMEGSIAFPLLRPVKLLLSASDQDGKYIRHEITLDAEGGIGAEQMVDKPKAHDNARLIKAFIKDGTSGNQHVDLRVKATCEGLHLAMSWVKENMRI